MHKSDVKYYLETLSGFREEKLDAHLPKIAMVRNRVAGGGLCIAANELANALYMYGYTVEILVDRYHSKESLIRDNLDKNIPIIPMLRGKENLTGTIQERRTNSMPWYKGTKVVFFDEFSNHVKTSYTEPNGQRVRIDYPFLEAYLETLKENDIVMTFDASLSWHVGLAKVPTGVKKVHQIHNQGFYWESLLDVSERFTKFVTLTTGTSEMYKKVFQTSGDNHSIIPNAVRVSPSSKIVSYADRKQKIVFAGRIVEAKGIDLAIKAFQKLQSKHDDLIFEIWGNGQYKEKLIELVNSLGISDRVHFKGHGTPKEIFSDAILHVLPSKREAFGLVVIEAMQFGTPTVATTTVFGMDEIVLENDIGFVSKTRAVNSFSDLIEKAMHSIQWNKFSRNCTKNIGKYERSTVYKQWLELLTEINPEVSTDVFFNSRLSRLEFSSTIKFRIRAVYVQDQKRAENILSFLENANPTVLDGKFLLRVPQDMVHDLGKLDLIFPIDFM